MDAAREPGRHLGDGILAIDADQVGEGGEQGGVGEHLRLDAVVQRLFPRIEYVSERLLLQRLAFGGSRRSSCRSQFWRPLLGAGESGTSQLHRRSAPWTTE